MSLTFKSRSVSIANFTDKTEAENEDYVHEVSSEESTYSKWVLCDGAGGVGVFSKEWAKYLAENVPQDPHEFTKKPLEWLLKSSKGFHESIIEKADLSDLILQKKVYRDGSYSTLCACWIDKEGDEIFYSSVGDTCLFFFERKDGRFQLRFLSSIDKQDDIDGNPQLLNWNEELKCDLPFDSKDINDTFIIVMASDSLARWIILNLAVLDHQSIATIFNSDFLSSLSIEKYALVKEAIKMGHDFHSVDDLLDYIKKLTESENGFREDMKKLHKNHEIEIDDYSLIFINGNVSK